MSYRSFKHLLGETSLERKCRFIFGGGILVLVTFSFYWIRIVFDPPDESSSKLQAAKGLKVHQEDLWGTHALQNNSIS